MTNKLFLIISLLLFSACSKTNYKHMYDRQSNPFHSNGYHTKGEADFHTLQGGENPMQRPDYDEYIKSIDTALYNEK